MSTRKNRTLKVGDKIPQFFLHDQYGDDFNIEDHLGKILIIYFYPKDESGICIKEACAFRDHYKDFEDRGALVIGINSGSADSHLKFAENHNLNFKLLSDPGNKVLQLFGVKNFLFLTGRETFVIDRSGIVIFKYRALLNGDAHIEKTLNYLQSAE